MSNLEQLGLLKMDFLGLKTLTVIDQTALTVRRLREETIHIDEIPLNDPPTYQLLNNAHTLGVFQLESAGMRDLARKVGIDSFDDLVALVALFRPGPMTMLPDYIKRKHGEISIEYDAPVLEPILKETYGVMLYQEQVMKIASEAGGFSLAEADILRKAMGKKIPEVMEKYRTQFVQGAMKNHIPEGVADGIYNKMAQFAGYGFNKSHSAAYALIAYQTAYLKANYPAEYMASLLTSEMGNTAKLASYIEECRRMGIPVLPPDVNLSDLKFTVTGKEIRFGLAAVKNAGDNAIKAIVAARDEGGPFKSLFDFCSRVDNKVLNKRVVESLVKSGAFDSMGPGRSRIFGAIDMAIEQAQTAQREKEMGQIQLFGEVGGGGGGEVVGAARYPESEGWPDYLQLKYEKEVLGLFISGHPLARHESLLRNLATSGSLALQRAKDGDAVVVGGIIAKMKTYIPKQKKERMAFVTLEDMDGFFEVVVFSDLYARTADLLLEDALVMVAGRVSFRDSEAKVIAEDIVPIDRAEERFARSAHVRFMTTGTDERALSELEQLVQDNQGDCKLFLHCVTPERHEVVIEASGKGLKPHLAAKEQIERLLGRDAIWFSANSTAGRRN
jgi:DNA polymerase-3 subunit alpha